MGTHEARVNMDERHSLHQFLRIQLTEFFKHMSSGTNLETIFIHSGRKPVIWTNLKGPKSDKSTEKG